jgi:hypothetical protein
MIPAGVIPPSIEAPRASLPVRIGHEISRVSHVETSWDTPV